MSFGKNLALLRNARGMTQQELADVIGRAEVTIGYWEREKGVASPDQLVQLADFFNVTTDFLLDREESTDPDIISVQRAMHGMDENVKQNMMTVLKIGFSKYFEED